MTENDKEIYLRVLADMPFMQEILRCCEFQTDEFASTMLRERINREREALRLAEDRLQRIEAERNAGYQEQVERRADD